MLRRNVIVVCVLSACFEAPLCCLWAPLCQSADGRTAVAAADAKGGVDRARTSATLPEYTHDPVRAAAYFDSLSQASPSDPVPAYWRARTLELMGDKHGAFCGYLRLESFASNDQVGLLAAARRMALERRWADAIADEGRAGSPQPSHMAGPLLLLPPDNLGPPDDQLFAFVWSYLLFDALRQAGVCVLPLSVTIAAQEILAMGYAVRVPVSVATQPVNTVEGLRGHLALLVGLDGMPYLAERDGVWDEDLQSALIRFQQESGIPPTGQADVVTQRRLQAALETWLLRLPPSLDPKDVPVIASWLGAGTVLRGTYQAEGGGYTIRVGLLDRSGAAIETEPILVTTVTRRAGAAAVNTARRIAAALGLVPEDAAVDGPAPEEFDPITASLLLMDRGMPHLALQRWGRAPSAWFSWRYLADRRRAGEVRGFEIEAWEEQMRQDWGRVPLLDPEVALDRMLNGLGRPGPAGGPLAWPDPGASRILGSEGILRIRGEIQ